MSDKTALILGGTGLVGGHCLNCLLNDKYYSQVKAITRRPISIEHPKLSQYKVNFDKIDEHIDAIQANDIYCCLGTTIKKAGSQKAFYQVDYTYPMNTATLSVSNEAENFILVTAMGANSRSSIFYNRVKGQLEQSISNLGFKGLYIFRPSLLLGKRLEKRSSEAFGQKIGQWLSFGFVGPIKKYKPIDAKAVAVAMVEMAKKAPPGKHIFESNHIQSIYDQQQKKRKE